jgi:hypothetical protein
MGSKTKDKDKGSLRMKTQTCDILFKDGSPYAAYSKEGMFSEIAAFAWITRWRCGLDAERERMESELIKRITKTKKEISDDNKI